MTTEEKSAYSYLVITITFWSLTPALAKLALEELNNIQLLFYVNLIAIASLFLVISFQKKLSVFSQYKKIDYMKMFGMSFLGMYAYYLFLYGSFDLAPAGQANMFNYLWPILIVIFSILILKEKFNYKTIMGILISFIGAVIVFTRGDLSNFYNEYSLGYLLAIGAAVSYGLFSVLGKKLDYERFTSMLVCYVFSVILVAATVAIFSEFVLPKDMTTLLPILFMGGLSSSIGYVFWFKALKLGHTHKMANMIYITPFLSLIFVFFINKEIIPIMSIVGLVLIICGILIQIRNK